MSNNSRTALFSTIRIFNDTDLLSDFTPAFQGFSLISDPLNEIGSTLPEPSCSLQWDDYNARGWLVAQHRLHLQQVLPLPQRGSSQVVRASGKAERGLPSCALDSFFSCLTALGMLWFCGEWDAEPALTPMDSNPGVIGAAHRTRNAESPL